MIRAGQDDVAEITGFLRGHASRSMFPLGNLTAYGLDDDHDRAPQMWLARGPQGQITDVLTISRGGLVMPQCPTGPWVAVRDVVMDRDISGVIGPAEQARAVMNAVGLAYAPTTLNEDEPLLELALGDLTIPDGPGEIVPLADVDRAVILGWMETYQRDALKTPEADVARFARQGYDSNIAQDSHVALIIDGQPMAMTGFNTRLPEIVQIGGVFTPSDLRGRGYARRAVALHLDQARRGGARDAVLFSANASARYAYEAIGFRHTGEWTLCLFDGPQGGPA